MNVVAHDPVFVGTEALDPSALVSLRTRRKWRAIAAIFGPAFIASIAYVDPGNFVTNFQAGSGFGYSLLWVVAGANAMAMLVQYLSAKLGIVTGATLPELCRERLPRVGALAMWLQAEAVAMATDVAEFVGCAIGINLLFGVPLPIAGAFTAVITFALLQLRCDGWRRFELAIVMLLGVIIAGFGYQVLKIGPSERLALGGLVPHLGDHASVLLAVAIVGATVMPHVIYLHSSLTSERAKSAQRMSKAWMLRCERIDTMLALGFAAAANVAMLVLAAKLLHGSHLPGTASATITLPQVHADLAHLIGGGVALAFAVALLSSGAASSSVGTFAGEIIMTGFTKIRIPLSLRRAVTMIPSLVVLCIGINPTDALLLSQVVLCFGVPFALVPLVVFTRDRSVMGMHVNARVTTLLATLVVALIVVLNVFLLTQVI